MTATQWPMLAALEPYLWLNLVILFVGWLCTFAVCLADAWLNGGEVPVGRWRMLVIGLAFYGLYLGSRGAFVLRAELHRLAVDGVDLCARARGERDHHAVADGGGLAVVGFGHRQQTGWRARTPDDEVLELHEALRAELGEQRIVELRRAFEVVRSEGDVANHWSPPSSRCRPCLPLDATRGDIPPHHGGDRHDDPATRSRPLSRRRPLRRAVRVPDDLRPLERNQGAAASFLEQRVETRQRRADLLLAVDDLDDDRQVLGEPQDLGGVDAACGAVAFDAPPHGGAGQAELTGRVHDDLVEGPAAVPVRLA